LHLRHVTSCYRFKERFHKINRIVTIAFKNDRHSLTDDSIALPKGAWARTHRRTLRQDTRPVLAFTQGRHRSYVYPLFTPAGYPVTTECPADHPHHNSLWIAADHLHCRMPVAAGGFEDYTYNFYVDETFQGRAPGQILETDLTAAAADGDALCVTQSLEWRGPVEWAAPAGRLAARETRTFTIATASNMHVIDVESRLASADWDFTLGPTRHAYFNVRVADSMVVAFGGVVQDDAGRTGGDAVTGTRSKWIDFSGPVGGGEIAGLAVFPDPRDHPDLSWFVADWGVVTVGPFRLNGRLVRKGEQLVARYRVLVHDGNAVDADVAGEYDRYIGSLP
jgi:Methane oxygenase PmoA